MERLLRRDNKKKSQKLNIIEISKKFCDLSGRSNQSQRKTKRKKNESTKKLRLQMSEIELYGDENKKQNRKQRKKSFYIYIENR